MTREQFLTLPQAIRNQPKISARYTNIDYTTALKLVTWWNLVPGSKVITSSFRTSSENIAAGGAKSSWHTKGKAFDVVVVVPAVVSHSVLEQAFKTALKIFPGVGVNRYKNYLHMDTRTTGPYMYYYDSNNKDHTLTNAILKAWSWSVVENPLPTVPSTEGTEPESPDSDTILFPAFGIITLIIACFILLKISQRG